ncbi:MAG: response regulator [Pseudomonadota bacterium]
MIVKTMIVDDSDNDRYLLKRWLGKCDFEMHITEARDGEEALDYLERGQQAPDDGYPPAIVFLDINMPRVNGFEFLEKFNAIRNDELGETVVVMFTSSPRDDDARRALAWDFVDGYLVKGDFATDDLQVVIDGHLKSRQGVS